MVYNGEKDFFITSIAIAVVCGGIGANVGPAHLGMVSIIGIVLASMTFPFLGPSIAGALACSLSAGLSHASLGWVLSCGVIGSILGFFVSLVSLVLTRPNAQY